MAHPPYRWWRCSLSPKATFTGSSSHSKLPSAERFERWVFDEVLPSIRQHGAYLTREKLWEVATSPGSPVEALLRPAGGAREERGAASGTTPGCKARPSYYDLFIDLRHSTNLRTTAKELDVPERRFIRFLLERRYVYRTPSGCVLPYAKGSNGGPVLCQGFLPQRPHRLLHAGDAKGQAALCGTSVPDFGDGMTGRHLLRRLVVPP